MPYAQFKQVWQDAEPIGRLLIATSRMMDWLRVVVPAPAAFLIGSGGVAALCPQVGLGFGKSYVLFSESAWKACHHQLAGREGR